MNRHEFNSLGVANATEQPFPPAAILRNGWSRLRRSPAASSQKEMTEDVLAELKPFQRLRYPVER